MPISSPEGHYADQKKKCLQAVVNQCIKEHGPHMRDQIPLASNICKISHVQCTSLCKGIKGGRLVIWPQLPYNSKPIIAEDFQYGDGRSLLNTTSENQIIAQSYYNAYFLFFCLLSVANQTEFPWTVGLGITADQLNQDCNTAAPNLASALAAAPRV